MQEAYQSEESAFLNLSRSFITVLCGYSWAILIIGSTYFNEGIPNPIKYRTKIITIEHYIKINKAAFALLIAVVSWVILIFNSTNYQEVNVDLNHHLVGVSEIVFFLLGAMTIVEIIDAHDGFSIISHKIKTNKKNQFIWLIALFTFFLSAILDNLTTTIVMVTILNKLVADRKTKWLLLGLVIISSNAGGAFSPGRGRDRR